MSFAWEKALNNLGHNFIEIDYPQNTLPYQEQAKELLKQIESLPIWNQRELKIHLLGHSAGGLIAKWIFEFSAHQQHITSVTTLATPHSGSQLAQYLIESVVKPSWKHLILKFFNYDLKSRIQHFEPLTPKANVFQDVTINKFSKDKLHCFIFKKDPKDLSLPLLWLRKWTVFDKTLPRPCDGIIELHSQKWHQVHGPFPLDHLEQIGYHFFTSRPKRELSQKYFANMVKYYSDLIQNLSNKM